MKLLNIGLDYDGTVTEDPEVWKHFCNLFRSRGHRVHIVTMRYREEIDPLLQEMAPYVDSMIFTGRMAKKPFVEQNHLLRIDIWIDDHPHAVVADASVVFPMVTPLTVQVVEQPITIQDIEDIENAFGSIEINN